MNIVEKLQTINALPEGGLRDALLVEFAENPNADLSFLFGRAGSACASELCLRVESLRAEMSALSEVETQMRALFSTAQAEFESRVALIEERISELKAFAKVCPENS
jgi:hypothetical protein